MSVVEAHEVQPGIKEFSKRALEALGLSALNGYLGGVVHINTDSAPIALVTFAAIETAILRRFVHDTNLLARLSKRSEYVTVPQESLDVTGEVC